jgi:glutamate formiminotransferase
VYLASRDRAQVSMNLVDYRRTSLFAALERVREEAAALGTRVVETEVIGLLPEAAVWGAFRESLQCPGFGGERVLEDRLRVGSPCSL